MRTHAAEDGPSKLHTCLVQQYHVILPVSTKSVLEQDALEEGLDPQDGTPPSEDSKTRRQAEQQIIATMDSTSSPQQ